MTVSEEGDVCNKLDIYVFISDMVSSKKKISKDKYMHHYVLAK